MKICGVIKTNTMAHVHELIKKADTCCDITEIWLDQVVDLDLDALFNAQRGNPLLFVNKGAEEQGASRSSESDRIALLRDALAYTPAFIDVGTHTEQSLINSLIDTKKSAKLIISYHNFESTPSYEALVEQVAKMRTQGADIVKIATMVESHADVITLLRLMEHLQGGEFIVLGMGKKGAITRIIGQLWGNAWGYAPLDVESAPGQLSRETLQTVTTLLS